jgi:methyl-accepting chemotaxis protein
MTIARKLILLVCIALVSLVVIGFGAAYELRSSQRRFEEVQKTVIPSIVLLSDASSSAAALRSTVRDYIIGGFINNPTMIKKQVDSLNILKTKIASQLDSYEKKYVSNDEDKALLNEDRKALNAYLAEVNDVIDKTNQKDFAGLSQQFSENGEFRKTAVRLIKSFSDHEVFNVKLADESEKSGEEEYRKSMTFLTVLCVSIFIALGVLGIVLIRSIRIPLQQMQSVMDVIRNDLDFRVRAKNNRGDEIGHTSRALDSVLEILQESLSSISERAKGVGDKAHQMAVASGHIASASHQQSEAASNMAATVEEMTVSINHVGDRARDADNFAIESGNLAKQGEEVIIQTVKEINDISLTVDFASNKIQQLVGNSQKISSVLAVIREVADQTNLLALNAAIEAARAGEQGRGFAVVADEVRKLAERTTSSTREIAETIETMRIAAADVATSMERVVIEVGEGVESIREASEVVKDIGAGSRRTVEVVEEITSAIREQASAMTSIAQQVEKIAQMSEESSVAAGKSAQVANDLDGLATGMGKIVSAYKL